jgi:LPPG:FO 2-phospho-L-lactate transferase
VIYALAEVIDDEKWWGIKGDTFNTHNRLKELGFEESLMIGDLDRAVHILRSELLRRGYSLTEAIAEIKNRFGIRADVLPMCEEKVATFIVTPESKIHFQEFWVKQGGEKEVIDVLFEGIEHAKMTKEVKNAIRKSKAVLIGPSNPITSIMPILSVKGVEEELKEKKVIAVSPIIGKKAVSGPAVKLMKAKGYEISPYGVADCYREFLDVLVVDELDRELEGNYRGVEIMAANIIMGKKDDALNLARFIDELI